MKKKVKHEIKKEYFKTLRCQVVTLSAKDLSRNLGTRQRRYDMWRDGTESTGTLDIWPFLSASKGVERERAKEINRKTRMRIC